MYLHKKVYFKSKLQITIQTSIEHNNTIITTEGALHNWQTVIQIQWEKSDKI